MRLLLILHSVSVAIIIFFGKVIRLYMDIVSLIIDSINMTLEKTIIKNKSMVDIFDL